MNRINQILDIEETQQNEQDQKTGTIDSVLVFCWDGTAHDDFHQSREDAPAVQGWNGPEVYHPNRDGQGDDDQQGIVGRRLGLTSGGWLSAGNVPCHGLLE